MQFSNVYLHEVFNGERMIVSPLLLDEGGCFCTNFKLGLGSGGGDEQIMPFESNCWGVLIIAILSNNSHSMGRRCRPRFLRVCVGW